MDLTITFPADTTAAELASFVEELESAGVELSRAEPENLQAVDWHSLSMAIGGSGVMTSLYHVLQGYLNRASKQRFSMRSGGIEITFTGGSPEKIQPLIKALAEAEKIEKGLVHGSKKAKGPAKKAGKKQAAKKRTGSGAAKRKR